MENQYFVDSEYLSTEALKKKHRLENDPGSRRNHMEYLPGMEQIESDVCEKVMRQMHGYQSGNIRQRTSVRRWNMKRVRLRILRRCSRLLLHRFWNRWQSGRGAKPASILETLSICLPRSTLRITAKTTVYTAALTAITISSA